MFTGGTFSQRPHDQNPVAALVLPEEDKVAPDEDTDMDLVADRLVLLSLPVEERPFTDWTTKQEYSIPIPPPWPDP